MMNALSELWMMAFPTNLILRRNNFCCYLLLMTSVGEVKDNVPDSWLKGFVEMRTDHVLTQQAIFLIY